MRGREGALGPEPPTPGTARLTWGGRGHRGGGGGSLAAGVGTSDLAVPPGWAALAAFLKIPRRK